MSVSEGYKRIIDAFVELMDDSQQFSAELDERLKDNPDDKDVKRVQEFLADRYQTLLFLLDA